MTGPTPEQKQRAEWDLLLLDIETRTEQLRQMKTFPTETYEGWKLAFAGLSAGAVMVAASTALMAFFLHLTGHLT